jgi:polysaccharide pyruvyl transferase WcaK-like protein
MSKKLRAVLCGYYGKGNGGNEALLATLLQMLPDDVEPIALTATPKETSQRYGVETCDRTSPKLNSELGGKITEYRINFYGYRQSENQS